MKLIEKVNAYKVLREMIKEEWPFEFAYKITQLMRFLEPEYQFFSEEEMKLVAAYGKKDEDGKIALDADGSFNFADEENMRTYLRRIKELKDTEMDVEDEPRISVSPPGFIKGEWLAAIEPFFDFDEYGEKMG